tara:strand:+ start:135 stop:242 length:108 start_codon:yes stop_codon:yes gene_type:complete
MIIIIYKGDRRKTRARCIGLGSQKLAFIKRKNHGR